MSITFKASSVSVEPNGRHGIEITVDADDFEIAEQLSDDSRLHDLDVDVVRKWILSNDDHDDILEAIGSEKIREFLVHEE